MEEIKKEIQNLEKRANTLESSIKPHEKNQLIKELEAKSMKNDFWSDVITAKKTMKKIAGLQKEVEDLEGIRTRVSDLKELAGLSKQLGEESHNDLRSELKEVEKLVEQAENTLFLSGPYDSEDAILSVHAGQGGVEAMDWAAILLRMYLRLAENLNWETELIEDTKGEEAGIKSASVEIRGKNVYGMLKKEAGTHRLVRQSPFNADSLRQTSFALVEVLPVIEQSGEIEIKQDDIEFDTFRSSAPGGQNVQKVNSAVRIRHKPTGITVSCQSERSQAQNREYAMKILIGKLTKLKEHEQEKLEKSLKGSQKSASWGSQIRSYVLHPYKQVKDLRTGVESKDPEKVLDGDLESFIEAEIRLGQEGK